MTELARFADEQLFRLALAIYNEAVSPDMFNSDPNR
jgi:hypothetical protein